MSSLSSPVASRAATLRRRATPATTPSARRRGLRATAPEGHGDADHHGVVIPLANATSAPASRSPCCRLLSSNSRRTTPDVRVKTLVDTHTVKLPNNGPCTRVRLDVRLGREASVPIRGVPRLCTENTSASRQSEASGVKPSKGPDCRAVSVCAGQSTHRQGRSKNAAQQRTHAEGPGVAGSNPAPLHTAPATTAPLPM
jgi:hypothetical protein